jgi:phosphohistidine phosphatase
MRHADAGDADARRWPDDRLRPLSARGQDEHRRIARALRRMGIAFDRLVSSPLLRARETAAIVAEAYEWRGATAETEALADRARPADLLREAARWPAGERVLCVGHEPHLSGTAAYMLAGAGTAEIEMRKSGMIAFAFEGHPQPGAGVLLYHLRPELVLPLAP